MPGLATIIDQALHDLAGHDPSRRDLASAPLCVGFSGGLDSTVLLHALARAPHTAGRELRAWHVHHGLHDDAERWVAHCQAFCAALSVPLTVSRVTVPRDSGHGPEAAARHARRAAFAEGLADGEVLALAHHLDDQAETFLLRALRASGPDGLGSMRELCGFGRGSLWRPLLGVPRTMLEAYAAEHGLHWIDDPSNADPSLDRNFLRQRVLPLLRERWPHAPAAMARSATLCAQAGRLLDENDQQALSEVAGADPATLSRARLLQLPTPRRARVLRRWTDRLGLPPLPAEGVARIESTLLPARVDASAVFEWHGAAIHAWRDMLHAGPMQASLPDDWQVTWDGARPLPLPGGGVLSLQRIQAASATSDVSAAEADLPAAPAPAGGLGHTVLVHARRGGERITLPGRNHSHSLKQVLQDVGVPPWVRAGLPLLSTRGGELLAAGDRVASADFARWLTEHDARLDWRPACRSAPGRDRLHR